MSLDSLSESKILRLVFVLPRELDWTSAPSDWSVAPILASDWLVWARIMATLITDPQFLARSRSRAESGAREQQESVAHHSPPGAQPQLAIPGKIHFKYFFLKMNR